jgi:hypothetical protein
VHTALQDAAASRQTSKSSHSNTKKLVFAFGNQLPTHKPPGDDGGLARLCAHTKHIHTGEQTDVVGSIEHGSTHTVYCEQTGGAGWQLYQVRVVCVCVCVCVFVYFCGEHEFNLRVRMCVCPEV